MIRQCRQISLLIFGLIFSYSCLYAQGGYDLTVFGTDIISKVELQAKFSEELNELLNLYNSNKDLYESKKIDLEKRLIHLDSFVFVNVRVFKSYTNKYDIIIDFVENNEEHRLKFREINAKNINDNDGLIEKWEDYSERASELFEEGLINDMSCPVTHCTWSFNHNELVEYLNYFQKFVPENIQTLRYILEFDIDPQRRASSAFLLAHSEVDNSELIEWIEPGFDDPSSIVRNNSLRVLYYAVRKNPEISFPINKVISALDYPSFTDRNKALVILRSINANNLNREQLEKIIPILLEILEKKDAHNFRNAYTVLIKITDQNFSIDDYESWKNWYQNKF